MGYEDDELKPFVEKNDDFSDPKRVEVLMGMGYTKSDIEESLKNHKYDDIFATYLLLGRRSSDVSPCCTKDNLPMSNIFTNNLLQTESDGSRSGSSLSLRNIVGPGAINALASGGTTQSPHKGVHRSISATNSKPSRRASDASQPAGAHLPTVFCLTLYYSDINI